MWKSRPAAPQIMIFLAIKKLIKILIYAAIILIAFLSYVYYTGKTVDSVIKPVEKAVNSAVKPVQKGVEQAVKKGKQVVK